MTGTASSEPVPARTELADILAERKLEEQQKFEKITGPRQSNAGPRQPLWWWCCWDAVRGRHGWLGSGDHDAALDLIRAREPRSSGMARAAQSVSWISHALSADSGPAGSGQPGALRDLAARAAGNWSVSRGIAIPADTGSFPAGAALAAVSPPLRDRVRAVLACLDDVAGDPGQAMVAISALLLAADQPPASRPVGVRVVLGERRRTGETRGVTGTLELLSLPSGPVGLFPDPRALRVIRANETFNEALRLAWESAAGGERGRRCVLWRLTVDKHIPDSAIEGGSFGAAFAIALRELLRGPESGPAVLPAVRAFFTGPRPGYAVTGALTRTQPPGYHDTSAGPWLAPVGDFDVKLQAAAARGLRLIAPAANRTATAPDGVHWARTLREADRQARHVRPVRTAMAALAFLAVAGVSTGAGVALTAGSPGNAAAAAVRAAQARANAANAEASQQHAAALSDELAALAVANLDTHLNIAQLLAVEATRIDNTPQARAALFQAATASPTMQRALPVGGDVTALTTAADGDVVVAGTSSGHLVRFDLATGVRTEVAVGGRAIGDLAVSAGGAVIAADNGSQAFIWSRGQTPVTLGTHEPAVSVAVSPSGLLAAVLTSWTGANGSASQQITVWSLPVGRQIAAVSASSDADEQVSFSSESVLTAASGIGPFQRYAAASLRPISAGTQQFAPPSGDYAYGTSANGEFSGYSEFGAVTAWPNTTFAPAAGFHFLDGAAPSSPASWLTISDDGRRAAVVNDGVITVSPLTSDTPPPGLSQSPSIARGLQLTASADTTAVSFLGSDDRLVSAAGDFLYLWDLRQGVQLGPPTGIVVPAFQVQEAPAPLAMSPDGRYLAMIDGNPASPATIGDPATLYVYRNGSTLTPAGTWSLSGIGWSGAPVWSGDQPLLIGDDDDGSLVEAATPGGRVLGSWPLPSGPLEGEVTGQYVSGGEVLIALGNGVESFDPVTGAGTYRRIQLSGNPHFASEFLVAISPGGDAAVLEGQGASGGASSTLVYVSLRTGAAHVIEAGQAQTVAFTRDRLLIELYAGDVQEWDSAGDRLLRTLPGEGEANGFTVSADGTLLAQVTSNGVAIITDLGSGQVIGTLSLPVSGGQSPDPWAITTMAFSPDDRYLMTATPGGALTRWDIGESDLIRLACQRAGGNLTPAIWAQFVQAPPPPGNLSCLGGTTGQ